MVLQKERKEEEMRKVFRLAGWYLLWVLMGFLATAASLDGMLVRSYWTCSGGAMVGPVVWVLFANPLKERGLVWKMQLAGAAACGLFGWCLYGAIFGYLR